MNIQLNYTVQSASNQSTHTYNDFDIRNYEGYLEPNPKDKNKYYCPVCGGNDLSINPKSGAYTCYNNDCQKDGLIIKALKELAGEEIKPTNWEYHNPCPQKPLNPALVKITKFPENYQPERVKQNKRQDGTIERYLYYSNTQYIKRIDYPNGEKKFSYHHIDKNGEHQTGKGNLLWEAYRLEEAIQYGYNQYLLAVEGEKCVEVARQHLGIPAITWRTFNEENIKHTIKQLQNTGIAGIIYIPDHDQEGKNKAQKVLTSCEKLHFPCFVINPMDIWHDVPKKGDIVDWIQDPAHQGMSKEDFIRELEKAIHLAVETKERDRAKAEAKQKLEFDPYFVPDHVTIESHLAETTFGSNWVVIDDSFYQYQEGEGYWKRIKESHVKKLIIKELKKYYSLKNDSKGQRKKEFKFATDNKLKSCFNWVRYELTLDWLTNNQHLLAFTNGTVDLRTGEITQHQKDNYLLHHIPLDYQRSEQIPQEFHKFLVSSYGEEQIPLIRAVINMFLDPTAPYGKFIHLIGESGGGKGTLIRLLKGLKSFDNVISISDFGELSTPEKRHQYLTNCSLAVAPDCGGYIKNLRAFYELVDNGSMSGRTLFSSHGYEKRWDIRFIMASVNFLQVENAGDGWKRRCIPIPTKPKTYKEDPTLSHRLDEERGLIVGWALSMDKQERDRLLFDSSLWSESNQQTQLDQDIYSDSVRAFIDLCCRPSQDASDEIDNNLIFEYYQQFCKVSGFRPYARSKFISHLKGVIPECRVENKRTRINGKQVRLKPKWINLKILEGLFRKDDFGSNVACDQHKLLEGGLLEFKHFFQQDATKTAPSEPPVTKLHECDRTEISEDVTVKTLSATEIEENVTGVTVRQDKSFEDVKNVQYNFHCSTQLNQNGERYKERTLISCHCVTSVTDAQKEVTEKVLTETGQEVEWVSQLILSVSDSVEYLNSKGQVVGFDVKSGYPIVEFLNGSKVKRDPAWITLDHS